MSHRRLPAEWEPQSGVMLVWPQAHGDWKHNIDDVEKTYVAIVSAICSHETVVIVCADQNHHSHIEQRLTIQKDLNQKKLQFIIAPSNDSWIRDTAPLSVIENHNRINILNFTFNGWGGKYPSALDNAITSHLKNARIFGQHPVVDQTMVLEGGSIETDGQGTLLTTSNCLSNPNRNTNLSKDNIEEILHAQLGAKRLHWLEHGQLIGDDTDGHIDTLARFCSSNTIAYTSCNDTADMHYKPLTSMAKELSAFKTTDGQPYQLKALPIPAAIHNSKGDRLPATYANFLIINHAVLVPTYDDPNDDIALQTLETCFPNRNIIGIDCRSLLQQFGSLHCATMHFPLGVLNNKH